MTRTYLLDTNMFSYVATGISRTARVKFQELSKDRESVLCISAVTEAEVRYGMAKRSLSRVRCAAIEGLFANLQIRTGQGQIGSSRDHCCSDGYVDRRPSSRDRSRACLRRQNLCKDGECGRLRCNCKLGDRHYPQISSYDAQSSGRRIEQPTPQAVGQRALSCLLRYSPAPQGPLSRPGCR
jgi:hypothetical protein